MNEYKKQLQREIKRVQQLRTNARENFLKHDIRLIFLKHKLDELIMTKNRYGFVSYMRNCQRCKRVYKAKTKWGKICENCSRRNGAYSTSQY